MKINAQYLELKDSYLFATVNRKVREYQAAHPDKKVIKLGIGDVTIPLCGAVTEAMHKAVDEMGTKEHFHGYGPEQGYDFLKEALQAYYGKRNVKLDADEIFISDGAKSDVGNILDIFAKENVVLIPDPVYPVYVDTNVMAGREVKFMDANVSNGFLAMPDDSIHADIIYLCSPNNPTGAVYRKEQLKAWVEYALANDAVILFDAAYEVFVADESLPRSIFEIEGARKCAIEFCSFSKTAGFTGTRCGYTVVPMELERGGVKLNTLWNRRQTTKFNGVPYVVQRGAAAVYTPEGRAQIMANIDYYRANAQVIREGLTAAGMTCFGGVDAPYIWLKTPNGVGSWDFFDQVLDRANVATTPGAGFGPSGEGYIRLTAFGDAGATKTAVERVANMFK